MIKVKYNGESDVSLTHGKVYDVMSVESGWLRLVDDTGEDYLFPSDEFEVIEH